MLSNPVKLVVHTRKGEKDYVGNVLVYGFDTESIGELVSDLSKAKNVISVTVNDTKEGS